MKDFGFYLVMTNPVVGYAKCAEAAVKAGVRIIQLRMKHVSREEILREAREVRRVTQGSDTLFIVNDDPEIAAEAGADGVHVGQDDLSPREVRLRFPELKIVGLSTHNLNQVVAANEEPVDYIGVGPVYATPTKDIPDPTLGLETMGAMIAALRKEKGMTQLDLAQQLGGQLDAAAAVDVGQVRIFLGILGFKVENRFAAADGCI